MIIYNVATETPGKRKGYYLRLPDGIIQTLEGNWGDGAWAEGIPVLVWAQHGARFDALFDYSSNKQAAMKKLAAPT